MRFVAFALVALIAISSVNADITNNDLYTKCSANVRLKNFSCTNAANPTTCSSQRSIYLDCQENDENCDTKQVADVPTYIICLKKCSNSVTDADLNKFIQTGLNCLSGSFLASVAMTLFALVSLLF